MFNDAKKYVKRKINKINYTSVSDLPEGYEDIEGEYKKLRDSIDMTGAVIKSFTHYEYGGQFMKQFSGIANFVASKSKIKSLKREDMYTDAALVGELLADSIKKHKSFNEISSKFAHAYYGISDAKNAMNERMKKALVRLDSLRSDAKSIDSKRKDLGNLRYDLEELVQSGNYTEQTKTAMSAEYHMLSNDTMGRMNAFIGDDSGVASILTEIMAAHREFAATAADALGKVK